MIGNNWFFTISSLLKVCTQQLNQAYRTLKKTFKGRLETKLLKGTPQNGGFLDTTKRPFKKPYKKEKGRLCTAKCIDQQRRHNFCALRERAERRATT